MSQVLLFGNPPRPDHRAAPRRVGAFGQTKPYYYKQPDSGANLGLLSQLAKAWTGDASRFSELVLVSAVHVKSRVGQAASDVYYIGDVYSVPASWPEPTNPTITGRLYSDVNGIVPYVPGGGAVIPPKPGTTECPDGYIYSPGAGGCVPKPGTTTGGAAGAGMPTWAWLALAGAGAVALVLAFGGGRRRAA